jgi:hypothetical protein
MTLTNENKKVSTELKEKYNDLFEELNNEIEDI